MTKTGIEGKIGDIEHRIERLEKVLYVLVDFRAMSIYRKDILKFREMMEKNAVRE